MIQQLPLHISLKDEARFENFYSQDNVQVVETLQQLLHEKQSTVVYCWGQAGAGLSHLLQACCHASAKERISAVYLPLREFPVLHAEMFQGLETIDVVCIDDIEAIAANREIEEALFDCYNRLRDAKKLLIVAAHAPAAELGLQLPDLVSRLLWGLVFHIKPLDDNGKIQALRLRAKRRGFELSDEVAHYIITHAERNTTALFALLDRLDYASLAEQRKITIPFVRKVLLG